MPLSKYTRNCFYLGVSIAKRQKTIKATTRQISFRNVRKVANIIGNFFRIIYKFNISSSSVRFMPFSCNSRTNMGEREGHLKTTLKKLVFFTSMWHDVLNRWMDSHPPVGLNPASSYNMNIINMGHTACPNIYVLRTKQNSAALSRQNKRLTAKLSAPSLVRIVQLSALAYRLERQIKNLLQNFPKTICHPMLCCFW